MEGRENDVGYFDVATVFNWKPVEPTAGFISVIFGLSAFFSQVWAVQS